MSNIKVVGLSGKASAGKDYIASKIITPGYGYLPISLSWHFKVWVASKGHATYEEVFFTKPPHVRHLLQQEGTELGRNVHGEDIWLNTTFNWMRLLSETWGISKFVITDIRFPNEVQYVQNNGGKVFRILSPNRVAESSLSESARWHPSETSLDHVPVDVFDGYIYNDPDYSDSVVGQVNTLFEHFKLGVV